MKTVSKVDIFGVEVQNTTLDDVSRTLSNNLINKNKTVVYTPNTEIVMAAKKDITIRDIINKGDIVIPDGIGLLHGARLKGIRIKERVTGYDTSMKLLDIANENGYRLYLLGSKDGIGKKAMDNLSLKYPNLVVSGYHHGYFKGSHFDGNFSEEENMVVEDINNSNTDILFVGFGFPKQELWINNNKDRLKVSIIIGNGGVIDILAGEAKRAPDIFIKMGLEWLYRLISDPSRVKRQIVLPLFLIQAFFSKNKIKEIK